MRTRNEFSNNPKRLETLKEMLCYWDFDNSINTIEDHKGCLTVTWNKIPNDELKEKVIEAWGFFYEYQIEHLYYGI